MIRKFITSTCLLKLPRLLVRPLNFKTVLHSLYRDQLNQTFLNEHNLRGSVCSMSLFSE